jgi:hypothetical protein
MLRSTIMLLAGALLAAAAGAQTSQRIEVAGSPAPLPDAATLSAMTGDFALSDGRALRVSRPGLHLMAAVGKRWAVALEPAGPNRFASRDGRLQLEYDTGLDSLRLVEANQVTVAGRGAGRPM